ncbi:MAG: type I 3-dehydroquinate dehydratase [Planctomycetaceae bacterium]
MICITVTPESRTLAPADLLNASRRCDLIELCLDHFINEPNVGELVKMVDKPILVSCRSEKDGGSWKGTEQQRIQLLREAIVAGPAYVELDLEIANSIPRFGKTQRVISFTSLNRPLSKIDEVFEQCWKAKADIVKFTWLTEDMDAAWPLLAAVTQQREVPIVGIGIGRSGLTFSLLGRKYGSPWIYAALERGMEAYPKQPTVWQLKEDYRWDEIGSKTRFLGVVGAGESENVACRVLNAAFQLMEKPIRCLPLLPGDLSKFPKMLEKMKINGLIVDPDYPGDLTGMAAVKDELASSSERIDVLMEGSNGWKGINTLFQAIDLTGQTVTGQIEWTSRGSFTVIGNSPMACGAAKFFVSKGAAVSISGPSDNRAASIAREAGVRHVPWNAVHDNRTDTLVIADFGMECGTAKGQLNPMIIRERMTVVDLSVGMAGSAFAEEARARGARYIDPLSVFATNLNLQFKQLTGRDLPEGAFQMGLAE